MKRKAVLLISAVLALSLLLSGCSVGRMIGQAIVGDQSGSSSQGNSSIPSGADEWEEDEDLSFGAGGTMLSLSEGPLVNEDGNYYVRVSPETLDYLEQVTFMLFAEQGDGSLLALGSDVDVQVDWETGLIKDNFTGQWPALPDGQLLAMMITDQNEEYITYSCPVYWNGEEAVVELRWIWEDAYDPDNYYGSYELAGVSTEDGSQDLSAGEVIQPVYFIYDEDGNQTGIKTGSSYTITGDDPVSNSTVPSGDYLYSFSLQDSEGEYLNTEPTVFFVDEDGSLYHY